MAIGITIDNNYHTVNSAADLARLSMNHLPRGNIRRLFKDRKYAVLAGLLVTPSGKIAVDGGAYGATQNIEIADNNQARGNRLYGTSTYQQNDVTRTKITPWVIDEVTWLYDSKEIARNRGASRIDDLMMTRKQAALRSLLVRLETQFLGTPTTLADDLSHTGLRFWCRGLASGKSSPEGGYNGIYADLGDGSYNANISRGTTSCDASDPSNVRLRGWAASYDGTWSPLLARQIRQAIDMSHWEDPTFFPGIKGEPARQMTQFRIYWPENIGHAYADAVNAGPDDRNGNLQPFWGDLKFGPAATVKTPGLNNTAFSPILGVDHSVTKLKTIEGEWLCECDAIAHPDQPTVAKQVIYCQSTVDCEDVRRNFQIHTVRT